MSQDVPKADDLRQIGYQCGDMGSAAPHLNKCLADDFELPLHGGAQYFVGDVIVVSAAARETGGSADRPTARPKGIWPP